MLSKLPQLDSPHAAGAIVIGAVLVLALMRKGFGGVNVRIGD